MPISLSPRSAPPGYALSGVSVLYEGSPELLPPGDHKALRKFEMLPRYFNFFIQEIRHEEFPFLSSPQKYKLGELIIISPDFTTKGHFEKVEEEQQQKETEQEEEEGRGGVGGERYSVFYCYGRLEGGFVSWCEAFERL